MIIRVSEILPDGNKFTGEESSSLLDVETDGDGHPESPISYSLDARLYSDELVVRGSLRVDMSFRCSKCGDTFRVIVEEPSFVFSCETKSGESVDLTADMREAIILAFPNYPVCRNDCKGLCARCGANLSREKCSCEIKEEDKWAALDNLKIK